jgi:DNA-3-methyladenine glycosylase
MSHKLLHSFFNDPVITVARNLIGKQIVWNNFCGIITETEAYGGYNDPASHGFKGPTNRSSIMFQRGGLCYVYLIYGMYHCLNITCDEMGTGAAVLIRSIQMENLLLDGPGKICRHFLINRAHTGLDLTTDPDCYINDIGYEPPYVITPRIGIKMATNFMWRFSANPKDIKANTKDIKKGDD